MTSVTQPEGWVFQALWQHRTNSRAKVCIPDTVLIRDGAPYRWLFTSRHGEVVRKRALDLGSIRDRFTKCSLVHRSNTQRFVGTLRFRGESSDAQFPDPVHLNASNFESFIGGKLAASRTRVIAVQAFVSSRGGPGIVFHNSYCLPAGAALGQRATTSTYRVQRQADGGAQAAGKRKGLSSSNGQTNSLMSKRIRMRDARLCKDLDATTRAVVNYMEAHHRLRVYNMHVEYIVDTDHRVWLTWAWNVVVRKHARQLPDRQAKKMDVVLNTDGSCRGSAIPGLHQPGQRQNPSTALNQRQKPNRMLGEAVERVENASLNVDFQNQLMNASPTVTSETEMPDFHSEPVPQEGVVPRAGFGIAKRESASARSAVPGAGACAGDFCNFVIQDPAVLGVPAIHASNDDARPVLIKEANSGTRQLFSSAELSTISSRLGSESALHALLNKGADPTVSRESRNSILFKSIALARKEKRGDTPPPLGLQQCEQPHGLSRATDAYRMKVRRNMARQLGMDGGAANYYKSVRVCATCFRVYSTLDAARELLQFQQDGSAHFASRASVNVSSTSCRVENLAESEGPPKIPRGEAIRMFSDEVQVKAHLYGAPKQASLAHQQAPRFAHGDPVALHSDAPAVRSPPQQARNVGTTISLPDIQDRHKRSVMSTAQSGLYNQTGLGCKQNAELERVRRVDSMPWNNKKLSEMASDPKIALKERARQRDMTRGGHDMDRFHSLENYVRRSDAFPSQDAQNIETESSAIRTEQPPYQESLDLEQELDSYVGHILVLDEEPPTRCCARDALQRHGFRVDVAADGTRGLAILKGDPRKYDAILISRSLPGVDGVEFTKIIRRLELKEFAASDTVSTSSADLPRSKRSTAQRIPIIAFTELASQQDLRLYMQVGMDGCVSKPLNERALLSTMTAAVPRHRPLASELGSDPTSTKRQVPMPLGPSSSAHPKLGVALGNGGTVVQFRPATTQLRIQSSQSIVEKSLKMPVQVTSSVVGGVFQMDADTAIPYTIIGDAHPGSRLFNFVVCHDIFDTCENAQIFFRPIVSKYPGMQVLVWNYPGQAFSEWRRDVTLNNKYLAGCLDSLLRHVGVQGTSEFCTDGAPFFLMGFGLGSNIAGYFGCHYAPTGPFSMSLRAVLSLNGYSFVGPHLAGVLHDCMNVFACSPANRPDLPVYFWTRFLFSATYLTRVSAPLALNLYTAVHNPITLEGRIQLCQGALASIDLRAALRKLHYPMVLVHSAQNGLVKPSHVAAFVESRGGEIRSIQRALRFRKKACVIWMKAGHELFQECRKPLSNLIEQLSTGFHETHDVSFMPADGVSSNSEASVAIESSRDQNSHVRHARSESVARDSPTRRGQPHGVGMHDSTEMFEDKFIDNILGTLHEVQKNTSNVARGNPFRANMATPKPLRERHESSSSWNTFSKEQRDVANSVASRGQDRRGQGLNGHRPGSGSMRRRTTRYDQSARVNQQPPVVEQLGTTGTLNPAHPAFERRENSVYQASAASKIYPADFPEVREYMRWRVQRNKKRLRKLMSAASCIQKSFRAYMARTLIQRMRQERAALFVQRNWRGLVGRRRYAMKRKEEWAVRLLQRNWRGKAGRDAYLAKREERMAATMLQRIYRGRVAKRRVWSIRDRRERSAIFVQKAFRAKMAREYAFRRRQQRNASMEVQRTWRGCLGRRRAALERDKYLFSKAQSQGIEFGRQMLMEHKLHGTRLQSEVALLTREKVEAEDQVETLLKEIAQFEEGVRTLEKEMHELSKVETEAKGVLDEEARVELREQKMRLDREFSIMLQKIADRKDQLGNLEGKLQTLDRHRQAKEEELRDLERKLVVLLEEQQKELEQIKQRQERRGERFIADDPASGGILASAVGGGAGSSGGPSSSNQDDRGYQGPSQQQQQQAAALMQSTETLMKVSVDF